MADRTGIEWTDATWNPVRGCTRVSAGCQHCYAERVASRFCGPGQPYEGLIHPSTGGWNGQVRLVPEALQIPWRWTRPRRIFVNSMSDLFHPAVPFEFIAAVFRIMSVTRRHTYQVLTKRPQRALEFFRWALDQHDEEMGYERGETAALYPDGHEQRGWHMADGISYAAAKIPEIKALGWEPWREGKNHGGYDCCGPGWPYDNVWLGVSVEDQAAADERIPLLLQCPAAVRWISAEPLLGPVDMTRVCDRSRARGLWINSIQPKDANPAHASLVAMLGADYPYARLDWVVAGGESGPGARPMSPDWVRSLRDQCAAAGVPFLFKQWGEHLPADDDECDPGIDHGRLVWSDGQPWSPTDGQRGGVSLMARVGKKAAGRQLDGVQHDAYPEATHV